MAGHLKNSWVGPFVCSLVITYIGIRPSSPVSRWASSWECWFTVFDLRDYERYLYSQYPFYLYLVERFTTGQSNIVHAWTNIELQSVKKPRNISHPLDRELLVGCPVLLQVTKPQRVPLLQLSERCSCTKRVQVRPRKSGQPPVFLHLLSCCSLDRLTEVVLNRLHRAQIPLTAWAGPAGTPTFHFVVNQTRFVSLVEEFHLDASVMLLTWTSQPSPQGRCLTDHWRMKGSSKEHCDSWRLGHFEIKKQVKFYTIDRILLEQFLLFLLREFFPPSKNMFLAKPDLYCLHLFPYFFENSFKPSMIPFQICFESLHPFDQWHIWHNWKLCVRSSKCSNLWHLNDDSKKFLVKSSRYLLSVAAYWIGCQCHLPQ